jgi:NAD(P)-dependent dehydrogenase (short-subunit alcohol dehydrogenase family)
MSLSGKYALITGSSRGIGRGIALKLAGHGVNVAVHYYQNEVAALDTLAQVRERGADGFVVQADARGRRRRCNAPLFRASRLDNWASDLRRWRRVVDES